MRRIFQRVCWCWLGRPIAPGKGENAKLKDLEKELKVTEIEGISEGLIDTTDWYIKDIQGLTPSKIEDKCLTREFTTGEDKQSVERMIKTLGYDIGNQIGQGGYGQVFLAYGLDSKGYPLKTDEEERVIKVMELTVGRFGIRSKRRMISFKNELFALVKSSHRNIISIQDHFIINNKCYLVMEFASGGNMNEDLKTNGPYSEVVAKKYFGQISSGIYYIHCVLGFAHFDIKLGNVLIVIQKRGKNAEKVIKISDFGLSRLRIDANKGVIKETDPKGTVSYMSPQVLRLYILERLDEESIYGEVRPFNPFIADIWAMGVCLYIMLCRDMPFSVEEDPRLLRDMFTEQNHKKWLSRKKWREVSKQLSIECKDIIEDMIEPNPHKRLTIQSIVSHVWFDGMYTIDDLSQPKYQSNIQSNIY